MGAKSAAGGSHAFACRHWSESQASISLTIVDGDMILIRMNENPGTGYRWELVQANANLGTCGTVWLLIVLYGTTVLYRSLPCWKLVQAKLPHRSARCGS